MFEYKDTETPHQSATGTSRITPLDLPSHLLAPSAIHSAPTSAPTFKMHIPQLILGGFNYTNSTSLTDGFGKFVYDRSLLSQIWVWFSTHGHKLIEWLEQPRKYLSRHIYPNADIDSHLRCAGADHCRVDHFRRGSHLAIFCWIQRPWRGSRYGLPNSQSHSSPEYILPFLSRQTVTMTQQP